jgi:hypothetical protein
MLQAAPLISLPLPLAITLHQCRVLLAALFLIMGMLAPPLMNQFRRLRVRYEKRADIHEAFLALACALLCWNALQRLGAAAIG